MEERNEGVAPGSQDIASPTFTDTFCNMDKYICHLKAPLEGGAIDAVNYVETPPQ